MSDTVLDYFFKVSLSVAPAMANKGFLHNAIAIVKANSTADSNTPIFVQSAAELAEQTDDTTPVNFLTASSQGLYVLPVDDLDDAEPVIAEWTDGYTVLFGSGFSDTEILAFDKGGFNGVVGANFATQSNAKAFAAKKHQCGYSGDIKNMFFAFGKLLGGTTWKNQQALSLPVSDSVTTNSLAESKFNDRVSFGITSDQYATRLGLFCAGGEAITAPYVIEEIKIMLQSEWLRYSAVNNPAYSITGAKLVQQDLQSRVLDSYIKDGLIPSGSVLVDLADDDFVASAEINFPRPRAWWRIMATIQAE